jgi:hypothetical protein
MDWQIVETRLSQLTPPFPREAVEAARLNWDQWGTYFIDKIGAVADGVDSLVKDTGEYDGMFLFACWLAAEKRDTRAYRPLVKICHCSRERAEEVFGDDLTGGLARQLASVYDGDPEPLLALAEDPQAAMWCRHAALHARVIRVIEGDGDRDALLADLAEICHREAEVMRRGEWDFDREPIDLLTVVVNLICDLGPAAHIESIRGWFAEGLIDPQMTGLEFFEEQAGKSVDSCLAEAGSTRHNRYVGDAIAEMEWWACFEKSAHKPVNSIPAHWIRRLMPAPGARNRTPPTQDTFHRETPKAGRNDPCPCGSGKKFKKCCDRADTVATRDDDHAGGVSRAMDWLVLRHEKAVQEALLEEMDCLIDEDDIDGLNRLSDNDWMMLQINIVEWLLAEGTVFLKDEYHTVADLVLAPNGVTLGSGQRRWIEELTQQPLRLYVITHVVSGTQITLCDAANVEASPVIVDEKTGSLSAKVGMYLAARVIPFNGRSYLSGAAYPFAERLVSHLLDGLKEVQEVYGLDTPDARDEVSFYLRGEWLNQYVRPLPLPSFVDHLSGEFMLFITDHYRVRDWGALEQVLATQADVEGDCTIGWSRLVTGEDGATRTRLNINIGTDVDRIELFYRSRRLALEGRPWFDALVGDAVEFVERITHDPKVDLMLAEHSPRPSVASPIDIPSDVLANLVEQTLHRSYAHWADEAIPALGHRTPRESIGRPAGLERVKGLLRSYAKSEAEMAAREGRRAISYDFLWQSLGLSPS